MKSPKTKKLLFFTILLTAFALGTVVLYQNLGRISKSLILSISQKTKGTVHIGSAEVNLIKHFPTVSVSLQKVAVYEHKIIADSLEPFIAFESIHFGFDLRTLTDDVVEIDKLALEKGHIHIVKDTTGTSNIEKFLGEAFQKENDPLVKDSVEVLEQQQSFELDQLGLEIFINQVGITVTNELTNHELELSIALLYSKHHSIDAGLASTLQGDFELKRLVLDQKEIATDLKVNTDIAMFLYQDSLMVSPSSLTVGAAELKFNGSYVFENSNLDFEVSGADDGLSIYSLILSEKAMSSVTAGSLNFKGRVRGDINDDFPETYLTFESKDLSLKIPKTAEYIRNLNFNGFFSTDKSGEWSSARLKVKSLTADLPTGYINASLDISDFENFNVKLDCDLETDINGFETIVEQNLITDLKGRVSVNGSIERRKHAAIDSVKIDRKLDITLKEVAFNMPGIITGQEITGDLQLIQDSLFIHNLMVFTDSSDALVNGFLWNIPVRIQEKVENIRAELSVQSNTFNLPHELRYYPSVRRGFDQKIEQINLQVGMEIETGTQLSTQSFPSLHFELHPVVATLTDYLPQANIQRGALTISDPGNGTLLSFRDCAIQMETTSVVTDFDYLIANDGTHQMNLNGMAKGFQGVLLTNVLGFSSTDTLAPYWYNNISGQYDTQFAFQVDSSISFPQSNFGFTDLTYEGDSNKLHFDLLNIDLDTLNWLDGTDKLISRIFTNMVITGSGTTDNGNLIDTTSIALIADYGMVALAPYQRHHSGKSTEAKIYADLTGAIPSFGIRYKIDGFDINDLEGMLSNDQYVYGLLDIDINVTTEGEDRNTLITNAKGRVYVNGKHIVIKGIDADKFINRFEKSQHFNLADLGAVMFMGPVVGLAVSKGSSYANLLNIKKDEATEILQLTSEVDIENGKVALTDVALSTSENLITASGWVDLSTDSLDLNVDLVDSKGCSQLGQQIYGTMGHIKYGHLKIFKALIAPVTNALEDLTLVECKQVYKGKVVHPSVVDEGQ